MSFVDLANRLRKRFKDEVELVIPVFVLYDNAPSEETPDEETWVRHRVVDGMSEQRGLGRCEAFRNPGIATSEIYTPVKDGDTPGRAIADVINAAFKALTSDGITYRTPFLTPIGRTGRWWQMNLNVPYFEDTAC